MANHTTNPRGILLCSALFLLFLIFKLTHINDWSWWLVTAPLYCWVVLYAVSYAYLYTTSRMKYYGISFKELYFPRKHRPEK